MTLVSGAKRFEFSREAGRTRYTCKYTATRTPAPVHAGFAPSDYPSPGAWLQLALLPSSVLRVYGLGELSIGAAFRAGLGP